MEKSKLLEAILKAAKEAGAEVNKVEVHEVSVDDLRKRYGYLKASKINNEFTVEISNFNVNETLDVICLIIKSLEAEFGISKSEAISYLLKNIYEGGNKNAN